MTLKSEFLATLRIQVAETHFLGDTPAGWRRIDVFRGGTFVGPRISARVLSGVAESRLAIPNAPSCDTFSMIGRWTV